MKIAIIAALDTEKAFLIENINHPIKENYIGKDIYQGVISGHQVIVAESGIGKVNSAIMATHLIDKFEPDYLINIGSAGGLNNQISIGDVVIADRLIYNDAFNQVFGYAAGQIPQEPEFFETDKNLRELILEDKTIKAGLIVTGDSFIEKNNRKQLIENFPDALATEMEGASIAQVAFKLKTPVAVIRSISDNANSTADVDFDKFVVEAGRKTGQVVIDLLSKL